MISIVVLCLPTLIPTYTASTATWPMERRRALAEFAIELTGTTGAPALDYMHANLGEFKTRVADMIVSMNTILA